MVGVVEFRLKAHEGGEDRVYADGEYWPDAHESATIRLPLSCSRAARDSIAAS